jgi:hypothetical protein
MEEVPRHVPPTFLATRRASRALEPSQRKRTPALFHATVCHQRPERLHIINLERWLLLVEHVIEFPCEPSEEATRHVRQVG